MQKADGTISAYILEGKSSSGDVAIQAVWEPFGERQVEDN